MDETTTKWMKSSYCDTAQCLEAAATGADVLIRNNTRPDGHHLRVDRTQWNLFVDDIRAGRFKDL